MAPIATAMQPARLVVSRAGASEVRVGMFSEYAVQHHKDNEWERKHEDDGKRLPDEQLQFHPGELGQSAHQRLPSSASPVISRNTSSRLSCSARRSAGTMPCATSFAATRASTGPAPSTSTCLPRCTTRLTWPISRSHETS